jgi:hypothetical protein
MTNSINPTSRTEEIMSKTEQQHPAELRMARLRLSVFVRHEASATAEELGFGWRATSLTPHGLDGLTAELRSCHATGLPFRVLKEFSDDTIFTSASTNWAMRFWHDTRHVCLGPASPPRQNWTWLLVTWREPRLRVSNQGACPTPCSSLTPWDRRSSWPERTAS